MSAKAAAADDDVDEVRRLFADKLFPSLCLSLVRILLRLEYGKGFDCLTSDNMLFSSSAVAEKVLLSVGISVNGILDVTLRAFDFASLSKGDFRTAILDARKVVVDRSLLVLLAGSSFKERAIKGCSIAKYSFCFSFQECLTRHFNMPAEASSKLTRWHVTQVWNKVTGQDMKGRRDRS